MKLSFRLAGMTLACAMAGPPAAAQVASPAPAPGSTPTGMPTAAPATPPPVALGTAAEAAWQRAVAAREAAGQRDRAAAGRVAASSWWASPPALVAGQRNDRWQRNSGVRESEVALSWPLLLPGQRAARGAVADAAFALAQQAEAAARLRIAGEVREAAWSWSAEAVEVEQAAEQERLLGALADDVQRRVRAGDLARADTLAARAESLAAAATRAAAQQRRDAALTRWTTLTGIGAPPLLPAQPPADSPREQAAAEHPELSLARAQLEEARKRLDLVRATRRDAPELSVGIRQDTPGRAERAQNPSQTSLAVGLRWPFGTVDRNRPLEAAALADLDVAQATEQRLRERLAAEAAIARAAVLTESRGVQTQRERSALSRERAQLLDKSFRAGETALPELLRALGAAADADAALARQQAALGLAQARLQQALGLMP